MHYQDFLLDFVAAREGGVLARVIGSPAGDGASVRFEVPAIERELAVLVEAAEERVRAERSGDRKEAVERLSAQALRALGVELFDRLIAGEIKSLYDESVGRLAGSGDGLRITLHLHLQDRDLAALHGLPWELLTRLDRDQPLGLDRRFSIVRYVPQPRNARPPLPDRLRILVASAEPKGCEPLNLDQEILGIQRAFEGDQKVEIVPLAHVTLDGLRRALVEEEFHALHFLGHGAYDPESGEGALYLEDGQGKAAIVRGRHLAEQLLDRSSLRLAFLNACRTARASAPRAFGGVATALVRAGLPAVIAMQFPITDGAAITFSETLYRRLAAGDGIDAAVTEGRLAIVGRQPKSLEWGTPVLFLHAVDGRLFDSDVRQRGQAAPIEAQAPFPAPPQKRVRATVWAAGLAAALGLGLAVRQIPLRTEEIPAGGQDLTPHERPNDSSPNPRSETGRGTESALAGLVPAPGGSAGKITRKPSDSASSATRTDPPKPQIQEPTPPQPQPAATGPSFYTLAAGESTYVAEVAASVSADFMTEDGVGFVRLVIEPDRGERVVRPLFGPTRIEFDSGGGKARVSILSIDPAAQRLRLQVQPAPG